MPLIRNGVGFFRQLGDTLGCQKPLQDGATVFFQRGPRPVDRLDVSGDDELAQMALSEEAQSVGALAIGYALRPQPVPVEDTPAEG